VPSFVLQRQMQNVGWLAIRVRTLDPVCTLRYDRSFQACTWDCIRQEARVQARVVQKLCSCTPPRNADGQQNSLSSADEETQEDQVTIPRGSQGALAS